MRSVWRGVAEAASEGRVVLSDQTIHMLGEAAYETGTEHAQFTLAGDPIVVQERVTTIYHRQIGGCKIVHHHTDVDPAMVEVVKRL